VWNAHILAPIFSRPYSRAHILAPIFSRLIVTLTFLPFAATLCQLVLRLVACEYQEGLYPAWVQELVTGGLTPAREIEKALKWDGVSDEGQYLQVVSAYLAAHRSRLARGQWPAGGGGGKGKQMIAFGMGTPTEIAIIGGVVLLLFGGAKLTEFGRSAGQGIRAFKKEVRESEREDEAPAVAQKESERTE
jgi:TatA/E family protein of Tat protein translocase